MVEERDILLYLDGSADNETITRIEQWIEASEANANEMEAFRMAHQSMNDCLNYQQFDVGAAWQKITPSLDDFESQSEQPIRSTGKVISVPAFWSIAASMLLLLAAASYLYINRLQIIEVVTGENERTEVTLPDQSVVTLESESRLTFPNSFKTFDDRRVTIFGNATFDVVTNPSKPFFVQTQTTGTEVLGTIFSIQSVSEEATLSNEEGLVKFFSRADPSIFVEVEEGETFVFDGSAFQQIIEEPPPPPPGEMMQVEDLIDELTTRYPVRFEPASYQLFDHGTDSVRILLDQDLEGIMTMLDTTAQINYQRLASGRYRVFELKAK